MKISQNRFGTRTLLVAAVVSISILAGCGMWQQQAPPANAGVASTPQAAAAPSNPPNQQAMAVPATTPLLASPAVSPKLNSKIALTQIHQTDMMEIALGKLAEQKASSDEVRSYADQLVKDHTNVDQMVIAEAPKSGIDLENGAAARRALREAAAHEKFEERKLSSAKGAEFDRLFLHQASLDNLILIRKLKQDRETASENATNDELEVTIDKTIPILEEDKKQAQILIKKEQAQAPANRTRS
jgi:putative membrane protein